MIKKKEIFRRDDKVKIINPSVFLRCGYPLNRQMVKDKMTAEQKELIATMVRKFGPNDFESVNEKVLDVMSGVILENERWGGRERSIHTELRPYLINTIGWVRSKRTVKTGSYRSGGVSRDYYSGYDDYDPPYLENEKTHIILSINVNTETGLFGETIEIEQCHVKKVLNQVEEADLQLTGYE